MSQLLGLCHELLHNIFTQLDPSDLASVSRSCRPLNGYVKNNKLLFKELYLQRWDNPSPTADGAEPDWEFELPKLVAFQKLLESSNTTLSIADITQHVTTLLSTASTGSTRSLNVAFLAGLFKQPHTKYLLLCNSSLYEAGETHLNAHYQTPIRPIPSSAPIAERERQLSAKLHCLYGAPIDVNWKASDRSETLDATESMEAVTKIYRCINPYARSRVYDLRRYTEQTFWGPFVDDGSERVDWEMLESIMVVLGYNLGMFSERTRGLFGPVWDKPFEGAVPGSFVPPAKDEPFCSKHTRHDSGLAEAPTLTKEPSLSLDARDPYGITGTWRRVVCFLDYNDFYRFNFSDSRPLPLSTSRPPITTQEAIRLITLKLHVTKIEPPQPHTPNSLPTVHFKGTSRSMHSHWDPNANSTIVGTVSPTVEGEIRWTTLSVFFGEARWRSEGIQIGGPKSARGVIGTWFDKDYDEHGPCGPTAFWKISDEEDYCKCPGGGQEDGLDESD
ncbi:hypothetical protein H2201_008224 [Coniosporium apollinis]|uniref:F-box domain-containing protein n=1 Tax=Coniosporium apollinis TaxID=61459 RepID=A0ABQ9NJL5_9PEZI|nr:hypothetical protein H2201_008224 [Coniosporium apollinis]